MNEGTLYLVPLKLEQEGAIVWELEPGASERITGVRVSYLMDTPMVQQLQVETQDLHKRAAIIGLAFPVEAEASS